MQVRVPKAKILPLSCLRSPGKFDFDTRISGVTSLNYEKSVVFGDQVQRGSRRRLAPPPETVPAWANRPLDTSGYHSIVDGGAVISNEEPSWEPFWAQVEPPSDTTVLPCSGTLAPRGGTTDYSDTVHFQVDIGTSHQTHDDDAPLLLVVRTEQDHWVWKLDTERKG